MRRLGRNIAWLLAGRGVAGMLSLAYLAIAARTLGPEQFGIFSLVIAYGGAMAALATVESGQAVIRFGALHLAADRRDRLSRLLGALALLDGVCALSGATLAYFVVPLVAPLFGWTTTVQHSARLFSTILLLSTGGTAGGALRLFDRFDLLAYAEAIGPLVRLTGAISMSVVGGGLNSFLLVWALAVLAESLAGWICALLMRRCRFSIYRGSIAAALRDNVRIGPFLFHNSLSGTLGLVWQYAGTFSVGALAGPAAAGGFRLAGKLASAIGKPIEVATRALYPELARLVAGGDRATLAAITMRVTIVALLLGLGVVITVACADNRIIGLLYGHAFAFAGPVLLLLTIATAIDVCGVALEPALNAHGRAGQVLAARALGILGQLGLLALLVPRLGVFGAGFAAIAGALLMRGIMGVMVATLLPG